MSPKFELDPKAGEAYKPEHFEHPSEGWLEYDPNTLEINPNREGHKPINRPIMLVGKFFGTKQKNVPTCSEPSEGNRGCSKWYGCPMKNYPHVGPGAVVMKKTGTVSFANCYDYFETTRGGRPLSQLHYGMEGWSLDTSRTTIDVLGRGWAIEAGILTPQSSREAVMSVQPRKSQVEVGGLLPPWWQLLKKKGLPLPPTAEHYPWLAEDDEPEEKPKRGRRRNHSNVS